MTPDQASQIRQILENTTIVVKAIPQVMQLMQSLGQIESGGHVVVEGKHFDALIEKEKQLEDVKHELEALKKQVDAQLKRPAKPKAVESD